jgi:hypothetical protein
MVMLITALTSVLSSYSHTSDRKAAWRTKGKTTKGSRHGKLNNAPMIQIALGK